MQARVIAPGWAMRWMRLASAQIRSAPAAFILTSVVASLISAASLALPDVVYITLFVAIPAAQTILSQAIWVQVDRGLRNPISILLASVLHTDWRIVKGVFSARVFLVPFFVFFVLFATVAALSYFASPAAPQTLPAPAVAASQTPLIARLIWAMTQRNTTAAFIAISGVAGFFFSAVGGLAADPETAVEGWETHQFLIRYALIINQGVLTTMFKIAVVLGLIVYPFDLAAARYLPLGGFAVACAISGLVFSFTTAVARECVRDALDLKPPRKPSPKKSAAPERSEALWHAV